MYITCTNNFEITCGGNTCTAHNTVLANINRLLYQRVNYLAYISVGSGHHASTAGITALKDRVLTMQAQDFGHNYDVIKGAPYLKKRIEFTAASSFLLSEAAFSAGENGADIINYAVVKDNNGNIGMAVSAGERVSISATVYINISTRGDAFSYVGGENMLFPYLFGENYDLLSDAKLVLSDSFAPDGAALERRDYKRIKEYPAESIVTDIVGLSLLSRPSQADGCEFILEMGGAPCIRARADSFVNGTLSESITVTAEDNCAYIQREGITETVSLTDSDGAVDFLAKPFVCGVSDAIEGPFDFVFMDSAKMFTSVCGSFFAVFDSDTLSVYDTRGGRLCSLELMPHFSYRNLRDILIDSAGNLYVLLSAPPYFSVYKNNDGVFQRLTTGKTYEADIQKQWLLEFGGSTYICRQYLGGEKVFIKSKISISGTSFSETDILTESGEVKYFCDHSGGEMLFNQTTGSFAAYGYSENVSGIVQNALEQADRAELCGCTCLAETGGKWHMYNIFTGKEVPLQIPGVRRIYVSRGGEYIVKLYSNNTLGGFYVNGISDKLCGFDIEKRIDGDILNVEIAGRAGIVVTAKNRFTRCVYLPANRHKICCKLNRPVSGKLTASIKRLTFLKADYFNYIAGMNK